MSVFSITRFVIRQGGFGFYLRYFWRLSDLSRGVHVIGFPPLFSTLVCLGLYRCSRIGYASKFCLFHFLYFSSVGIIHFATASVVRVVMEFFISQGASKFFIDFCAWFC